MNQIAQQGKDMLEIVEKFEVPREYHSALWASYEAGAHMGFFKALGVGKALLTTNSDKQTEESRRRKDEA